MVAQMKTQDGCRQDKNRGNQVVGQGFCEAWYFNLARSSLETLLDLWPKLQLSYLPYDFKLSYK